MHEKMKRNIEQIFKYVYGFTVINFYVQFENAEKMPITRFQFNLNVLHDSNFVSFCQYGIKINMDNWHLTGEIEIYVILKHNRGHVFC